MQRVLCMKLLTKTLNSCKIDPIPVKISPHPSKTANTLPPIRHLFSEYTTCSYCPPKRAFFDKISYGFFSNPILANHLLRKATLKDLSKSFFNGTVMFSRFQHSKGISHSVDVIRRSWFRRLTVGGVIWGLIMTNVAVYSLWRIANREFMMKNFMISVDNIRSGRLHTLITNAFSHHDTVHIISNMIGLYFFGNHLGSVLGANYLLRLYFTGALAGSVFFLVYHAFFAPSLETRSGRIDPSRVLGLGASGAVNAIMLLDIFLFPKQIIYVEFIIPVPAMLLGIFIIGKDLYRVMKGDSHISGSAHLGGAAVAALSWYKIRRGRF